METALAVIIYGYGIAGLIWLLDHIPAHKGDRERFFKREGQ